MTYIRPTFEKDDVYWSYVHQKLCTAALQDTRYYVYAHADDSGIFYIGKGQKKRAWDFSTRSREWQDRASGKCIKVLILHRDLTDRQAHEMEKRELLAIDPEQVVNITSLSSVPSSPAARSGTCLICLRETTGTRGGFYPVCPHHGTEDALDALIQVRKEIAFFHQVDDRWADYVILPMPS